MNETIVTGQQIGLLGGPLYTTYKVLGAVCLAKKMKGKAVYWLETNDADFEEVNRINYLDDQGKLRNLKWNVNSQGYSVGFIEVNENLVSLLNYFFDTLSQTEYTDRLRSIATGAYRPGKTLAQSSKDLASRMFGHLGIQLFDPQDREFLRASRDLLIREAERTPEGKQCNLFCVIDKKRVPIFRSDSGFFSRDGNRIDLNQYDLVPNVRTRNIIQDRYFNTHTYVAGPSETDYIAELDDMYAFHRVRKARVVRRMSLILIEPIVSRILTKLGENISEILKGNKDEYRKKVMNKLSGFDHQKVLKTSEELTRNYVSEIEKLGLDAKKVRRLLNQSIKEIVGFRRAQEKKEIAGLLNKADSLFDYLKPYGKKQERVFNLFYYMNLYGGIDFINWLYDHYDSHLSVLEIKNEA